ncbi:MAG TPA: signal peptidase II, partial [Kofleriaceae bacterium]
MVTTWTSIRDQVRSTKSIQLASSRRFLITSPRSLVAGGAVGNLIDRIYYSVVTDFVLWKYKTHE